MCSQLNVPVSSQWKACSLAISPFQSVPEEAAGIDDWACPKVVMSKVDNFEEMPLPVMADPVPAASVSADPKKLLAESKVVFAKPKVVLAAKVPLEKGS